MTGENLIETGNFLFPFLQKWNFLEKYNEEGSLLLPILLGIFIFFRICTLIRVAKDISMRSKSFWYYFFALLIVLVGTPIFGGLFYLAIRPKQLISDRLPRKEALSITVVSCRNCGENNLVENRYCTACGEKLKVKCHECGKEIAEIYGYCPICGAPNIE